MLPTRSPDWRSMAELQELIAAHCYLGSEAQILEERRRKAEKWQTYFGGAFV